MCEIKQVSAIATNDDVGMLADDLIVLAPAGCCQQVCRLRFPRRCVDRAVNAEPLPLVVDEPVLATPTKDFWPLARFVADGLTVVGPGSHVGAIGVIDRFFVTLVVVPKPPTDAWHL